MYGKNSMGTRMKTTLNLDDGLVRRAKRVAAERGTTLTQIVEDALRDALREDRADTDFRLSLPTVRGHSVPSVDPADRDRLYDVLDPPG
jgi:hypothetical protein